MWFLILVRMTGTVPDVYPIGVFHDYDNCMVVLREVEFGVQGEDEALLCLKEHSEDQIRYRF